jgi:hypothetical protein
MSKCQTSTICIGPPHSAERTSDFHGAGCGACPLPSQKHQSRKSQTSHFTHSKAILELGPTVVADLLEPFWQAVLHEATHELGAITARIGGQSQ